MPAWRAAAPMIWTSKGRWPRTRLAASRTVANASTWMSSSVAPLARRSRNSTVFLARASSSRASNSGSRAFTASTIPWKVLRLRPSPMLRSFEKRDIERSVYRTAPHSPRGEVAGADADAGGRLRVDEAFPDREQHGVVAGAQTRLVEDVADVVLDGVLRDEELLGDLLRRQALGDFLEDLDLPSGQCRLAGHRHVAGAEHAGHDLEELGRHLRRCPGSPGLDVAQRRHEPLERGVFRVVAAGAGLDRRQQVLAGLGGGEQHHGRL